MNRIRRFKTTYPYNPTLCRPRIRHPIKIMVWGCFCSKGIGNLKICEGNMNSPKYVETLEHFLLPSIQRLELGEDAYHLDDSAPCHRTKKVDEWHEMNNIKRIEWPGNSPDLNPIENLWHVLKFKIRRVPISNKKQLIKELNRIWENEISNDLLKTLANSMNRRLKCVIKVKGGLTKY